jgi:hypothetical protein
MMLADSAQVAEGKIYMLGGGWSLTGPGPTPSAVVIKLEIDRHETGRSHYWELFLEDSDGQPVMTESLEGLQPIEVRGEFTVGNPEDLLEGVPVDLPIAINVPPLPLDPASRFTWRLVVNGDTPDGGTVSFSTRPEPAE